MNTNEQTELGKLAFFTYWGDVPTSDAWEQAPPQTRDKWTQAASAVEQAVLDRLPGEYVFVSTGERLPDDETFDIIRHTWHRLGASCQSVEHGWPVRRRIRPTEAKAEPEWVPKFKVGDEVQIKHPHHDWDHGMKKIGKVLADRKRYVLADSHETSWPESALKPFTWPGVSKKQPESPFLTPEELRAMLGGREPHRLDGWKREWLTDGWRPLFRSEHDENGDQQRIRGDWQTLEDCGFSTGPLEHHCRTKRSLPLPPTTEQKPEGKCPQIGGTIPSWEAQGAFVPASSESPPQGADDLPITERVVRPLLEAIDNQIAALTKERDEARESYAERDSAYGSVCRENRELSRIGLEQRTRAEQAEKSLEELIQQYQYQITTVSDMRVEAERKAEELKKKLAEVERKIIVSQNNASELAQKLQQAEASVPRWVATGERMPTKEDADERGKVWVADIDGVESSSTFIECVDSDGWDFWMTPIPAPIPTPTDENDPERLAAVAYDSYRSKTPDGEGMSFADFKIAFLAGQASNSPLTKD